ncbi:MAG TPA: glycoside hydrolase family 2, partial [Planctomycetes bacterium]|nr:glycoside hydrolase family 2 [Planctomycetota bacterium]
MNFPRSGVYPLSLFLLSLFNCASPPGKAPKNQPPRARISLDRGWRFHLGDPAGAERAGFDDSRWRRLDLPHDWSIEGKIDLKNPTGWRGGFYPAGVGWYRKTLSWEPAWRGRKVRVDFDGVFMLSRVWINGRLLGERPYGYIGFSYDLTPYLRRGKNILAVRVDDSKVPNVRWYPGCGIYRHVWLTVTGPVRLDKGEIFVSTQSLSPDRAVLEIRAGVRNGSGSPLRLRVTHSILDPRGRTIRTAGKALRVPAGGTAEASLRAVVNDPLPWSPSSPSLYRLVTFLSDGKKILDRLSTPFGIRTIRIDPAKGFFLNGKNLKFKGVCLHQDGGPVGSAVPEDVWRRRFLLLKKMGCNAVRTAHNPAAPEFYDLCDELGLMVMDEAFDGWDRPKAKYDYGLYFKEWWRKDLEAFVRRDRNHPSVVIWSIGNEVPGYTLEMQKKLYDLVKSLDPTRPVTQGRGEKPGVLDIVGFNGRAENKGVLERFHKRHPEVCSLGTE